jgi:POT family proton-dependent oligopeptide transporter
MDRNFLGFQWLPSQIQSLNSVFVLTFIPIFSLIIYPWVEKFCPLSPLRKMGAGFVLMAAAFVLVSLIQVEIDAGGRPNIAWQIGAFALLTAAEILVSIVALEFAYTQAPRKMKSFIMCFYLGAVAVGNIFVWGVNQYIQIPSAADEQLAEHIGSLPEDWQGDPRTIVLPGYNKSDVEGAYVRRLGKAVEVPLEVPGQKILDRAAQTIISHAEKSGRFPAEKTGTELLSSIRDYWGRPLRYLTLNSTTTRVWSAGGDGKWNTKWDVGIIITKAEAEPKKKASWLDRFRPEEPWLTKRKRELGLSATRSGGGETYSQTTFAGGQVRLQGAAYFWFFSSLMGVTAILFIPFAMIYRQKNYLQDS